MSATMSATIEPDDLPELEQQSDRRRSRSILLSPPSGGHVDAREQKEVAHLLLLLPEEAGDRPYQHRYDYVGSDSADDDCCDHELERCLREEMDGMDSSDESTEDDDSSYGHNEEEKASRNELGRELGNYKANDTVNGYVNDNVKDNESGGDVFATLEWSQFVSSVDGVRRYMEGATTEILEVSASVVPSPLQQSKTHERGDVVAVTAGKGAVDSVHGIEFLRNSDGAFAEDMAPVIPPDVDSTITNLVVGPMPQLDIHCVEQGGRMVERSAPAAATTSGNCSSSNGDGSPWQLAVAVRSREDGDNVFIAERDSSREGDRGVVHPCTSKEVPGKSSPSRVRSSTWKSNAQVQPGCNDEQTSTVVTAFSILDATAASSPPTTPQHTVLEFPPAQQAPLEDVGKRKGNRTERMNPEAQAPRVVRSFEVDRSFVRNQEISILKQLKEACDGNPSEVPPNSDADVVTQSVVVMASVQEEEVERRIQRDKAKSVGERRKLMAYRLSRARRVRSAVVFQAVWRGRCTRASVSQIRAARRQELEEVNGMYQEEQLATRLAACEVNQKKEERINQAREQSSMRDEDERTSKAWNHLAQREETTRAEELARMRAEERYTRALLDLELQDSQRVDRARREAVESAMMRLEDLTMQELRCVERAQAAERAVMGAEDALARKWKNVEKRRLAVSQSERRRMASEDWACSAWNAEHRREQEVLRLQARARSTPIQRAMDPRGVATARSFICALPYRSGLLGVGKGDRARSDPPAEFERRGELVKERARRRECYKRRLDRISARCLNVSLTRFEIATPSKHLGKISANGRCRGGAYDHPRGGPATAGNDRVSPREGRAGPTERDGAECDLTIDMLSYLGPLQDLAELELCVEGLTSASLLRECTSLKSLSLNVNRLSSPAGLIASTTLVRLGLRDNRLTSLQGLSGLPNLRELRLDINHLTSLHELTSLPSLVELSANTNHISALPEGFATALMAPSDPPTANSTNPVLGGGSVESTVACGGLQKLELYHNRIEYVHPRALEGLMSLTHLDLGRNQLKTLDGRSLESCPALSTLVLSQNLLRESPSPLCLPLLSELWLSGNQIACMGAWAYARPPPQQQQTPPFSIDTRDRQRQACLGKKSSLERSQEGAPVGLGLGGVPKPQYPKNGGGKTSFTLDDPGRCANIGGGFEGGAGGRGGSTFAQGGLDADDGSFVWLPTLEVLHLQDNCLESLGGRWSLAGCPLLRSFDASFNQLRAPDEIAACLQACGDLREVRLHDNPASTCENYADSIALSCPLLVQMDGVGVDTTVHRRAAAKTYGRRADLVLPFLLLDASEPSESRAPPVTADSLLPAGQTNRATDHVIGEPNASCLGVNESQQCPWCGVTIPSTTSTESDVSGTADGDPPRDGNTADEPEPGGRRDAATISREREFTTPISTTSIGNGGAQQPRRRQQYTCASCGGELPDTDLWRVQVSRDSRCSVRWHQVLSEGRRWRAEICGEGASAGDKLAANGDGAAVGDAFRRVCLEGRDERASMKRRHRREERGVAFGGHQAGAQTQIETVTRSGGSSAVRSGSMTASRWRLETELELSGRHAQERRELAARQLFFHASGGGVCDDREGDDACVIVGLGRSPTEKGQHTQTSDNGCEIKIRGEQARTTHRRDQAVRVIQRLRHRRQERVAPRQRGSPSEHGLSDHTGGRQASERAVTKVQSAFRGFHIRRTLQAALDSARYVDEELEGLLRGNGGARFEFNAFLAPPPELADGWWGDRNSTATAPPDGNNAALNGNPSGRARATSNRLIDTACAVVSNTPWPERARESQGMRLHDGAGMETPNRGIIGACGGRCHEAGETKRSSAAGHGARMEIQDVLDQQAEDATPAAPTTPADPTRETKVISHGNGTQDSGGTQHEQQTVGVSRSRDSGDVGDSGPVVGAKDSLVTAWGLSDPMAALAMMKRARRLRKFQTAEARRVKLREPEVRFNAFARKAGGHRTLRSMSDLSSRRDIDRGIGTQCLGTGAGAAEAKREQGSPESGSRAVRPRLGLVIDGWARGETAAPRSALPSPHHMRLHDHGKKGTTDQQPRHNKANSSSFENQQPAATRPPSSSSSPSCTARPWPPPKPQRLHNTCRRPSSNTQPCDDPRGGWGGGLSRQSSTVRGGRPRATLRAVELGAEAVLEDGDGGWVGGGHGAGGSSKVKLRAGAKPSSGRGGGERIRRVI